jgi:transposase
MRIAYCYARSTVKQIIFGPSLLVNPAVLSLEKIGAQTDSIIMVVATSRPRADCPQCQQLSLRVQSRYQRVITDLPWGEITVKLELQTRKFFCDNEELEPNQKEYVREVQRLSPEIGSGLKLVKEFQ